jgi:hypothetical protein
MRMRGGQGKNAGACQRELVFGPVRRQDRGYSAPSEISPLISWEGQHVKTYPIFFSSSSVTHEKLRDDLHSHGIGGQIWGMESFCFASTPSRHTLSAPKSGGAPHPIFGVLMKGRPERMTNSSPRVAVHCGWRGSFYFHYRMWHAVANFLLWKYL